MKKITTLLICLGGFITYLFAFEYGYTGGEDSNNSRKKKTALNVETRLTDKNTSTMMINYHKGLEDKIITVEVPTKIYDVGMTSYTKEFADKYGYPYEYVDDLSPGMQAIGFEMKTMRAANFCYLNVLLDENLEIDYPEDEYINPNPFTAIKLPEKRQELKDKKKGWRGYKVSEEYRKHLMDYSKNVSKYGVNTTIATSDYEFRKKGGARNGISLYIHTKNTMFPNTRYFSFSIGCGALMHKLFSQPSIELWLKNKGAPDFGKVAPKSKDDFMIFKIPDRIRVFAEKMMFDTEYNGTWEFTKDYYETNK